jgi:hypothetical protein
MQTRRQVGSLALLVSMSSLPSCSLMSLDDFGNARCVADADCARAEAELRPSASACGSAACMGGLCQWHEPPETCNGQDDDCNGLIDDNLVPQPGIGSPDPLPTNSLAYAIDWETARTFVAVTVDDEATGFMFGPGVVSKGALQYESGQGPGCPKAGSTTSCNFNFAEVALAADTHHLVVASINTNGCAEGQLRVGLSELEGTPFTVQQGKPMTAQSEDPDNIELGVNVYGDRGCTIASSDATNAESPPLGATHPAVASLGTEEGGEGALLVWLAAAANEQLATTAASTTGNSSVQVVALGLVVSSNRPEWLNGSDGGKPTQLGSSMSRSAPAVLALKAASGGKYLVAFPAEQGGELGIQLSSVHVSASKLQSEVVGFLAVGVVDDISLELGNTERAEVGLAWRSGTGVDAQLCFTIVSSSAAWPAPRTVVTFPAPNPPDPRISAQLLYRDAGFATDAPTGGWFLSWVEGASSDVQTTRVARIRDGTFAKLYQSAPLPGPVARRTLLLPSLGEGVGYAIVGRASLGDFVPETKPAWCD